jgi:hypothetical protein
MLPAHYQLIRRQIGGSGSDWEVVARFKDFDKCMDEKCRRETSSKVERGVRFQEAGQVAEKVDPAPAAPARRR